MLFPIADFHNLNLCQSTLIYLNAKVMGINFQYNKDGNEIMEQFKDTKISGNVCKEKGEGKGLEGKAMDKYIFSVVFLTIATSAKADALYQTSQLSHIITILRVELLFSKSGCQYADISPTKNPSKEHISFHSNSSVTFHRRHRGGHNFKQQHQERSGLKIFFFHERSK